MDLGRPEDLSKLDLALLTDPGSQDVRLATAPLPQDMADAKGVKTDIKE